MHALWILSEAMWRLLWQGRETWDKEKHVAIDLHEISLLLGNNVHRFAIGYIINWYLLLT